MAGAPNRRWGLLIKLVDAGTKHRAAKLMSLPHRRMHDGAEHGPRQMVNPENGSVCQPPNVARPGSGLWRCTFPADIFLRNIHSRRFNLPSSSFTSSSKHEIQQAIPANYRLFPLRNPLICHSNASDGNSLWDSELLLPVALFHELQFATTRLTNSSVFCKTRRSILRDDGAFEALLAVRKDSNGHQSQYDA